MPRAARWVLSSTLCSVLALNVLLASSSARADEFSILEDSSVIGRNFGYPLGTPGQEPTPVGEVDLVVESAFYLKNLELLGLGEIDGETFFGVQVPLRLRYRAARRLHLELGAIIGQDFGDSDRLNIAEPLIRLAFEPVSRVHIIAGTILPTHWIHDALHDDTHTMKGNAEQGFQLRIDRELVAGDAWINWRIREGEFNAEEFEIATSWRLRLLRRALWLDAHAIWAHVGGQKNASDRIEQNLGFYLGGSGGLPLPWRRTAEDEVRVLGGFLYGIDSGRDIERTTGSAWQIGARLDSWLGQRTRGRLHGSYLAGSDLAISRGDPLYGVDVYGQLGVDVMFELPFGLRVETGMTAQWTDAELNYTYLVAFVWGRGFPIPVLHARAAEAAP